VPAWRPGFLGFEIINDPATRNHMKLPIFLIIDNVAKLLERRPTVARSQRHYSSLFNRDVPTT
jgi:hypothetical protein